MEMTCHHGICHKMYIGRESLCGSEKEIISHVSFITTRTLFIWMVSLYLGWEQFSWIQVIGFAVMVMGTFYFNGVLRWPFASDEELASREREPLLRSPDTEATVRDD